MRGEEAGIVPVGKNGAVEKQEEGGVLSGAAVSEAVSQEWGPRETHRMRDGPSQINKGQQ